MFLEKRMLPSVFSATKLFSSAYQLPFLAFLRSMVRWSSVRFLNQLPSIFRLMLSVAITKSGALWCGDLT